MQLRHAARTDVGSTRDHNEDSYGIEAGRERAAAGALFVVCDGVGGYASGEVASDLAVKTIIAHYYATSGREPEAALRGALAAANRAVYAQGGGKIGTTGVAALFRDDALIIANVGDCRAYLIRNEQPRQITRDHSFVAEQVAAGMLTEDQARESSYRNIITRAIGQRDEVEVDVFREPLLQHDIVVLCSDGLHGQVDPDEIALAVTKVPLDDACRALIKLANERGGPDNITIIAVQVLELTFMPDVAVGGPERSASVAKTAKLGSDTAAVPASGTEQLPAFGPAPLQDRRKGNDRRSGRPGSAADRRQSDDRRASVAAAAPPLPAKTPNPARGFVVWLIGALLIGVLLVGAYFYAVSLGGTSSANPFAAPPTQTSIAPRSTPTMVSTPGTTTTPGPSATSSQ